MAIFGIYVEFLGCMLFLFFGSGSGSALFFCFGSFFQAPKIGVEMSVENKDDVCVGILARFWF